ncbi:MAG: M28 family peptidase [Candidatus Marinimicrobia bacterium]|nr:M28 family peptidase [Candidatus Neomarinimicrobiota bacterium]MBT7423357.1 M28 family peptidase [Candidatus Neomarinimicrobiota bacterium]
MKNSIYITLFFITTTVSCQKSIPLFDGNSAFNHLIKQCELGPRNPGSNGHKKALEYFLEILNPLADTLFTQSYIETMPRTGEKVDMNNVIARFNTSASKQIMISAHWDTRPWGDRGSSIMEKNQPILGANDGASGVAVLLELAKILKENPPKIGVSLVLFDAEDYGSSGNSWTYCKGSQYFAKNLPIPFPAYAINLDMIADKFPEFYVERYSYQQNPGLVLELWEKAEELGLTAFKKQAYHMIFDDHVPLYEIAGIPAIDIIDFDYPNEKTNYHHTQKDIVANCSPEGLSQVGTLMVHHIYEQK